MEDQNKNATPTNSLCTAGCGFYGSEHFLGLCSKCYGAKNKGASSAATKTLTDEPKPLENADNLTSDNNKTTDNSKPDEAKLSRKHPRPSSIISSDSTASSSSAASCSIQPPTSPLNITNRTIKPKPTTVTRVPVTTIIPKATTTDSSGTNTPTESDKPVQTNKGRCFKCRIKVPLAKQTINKCRCDYVFCDSHRFPDRHECEVDYAKIGRDLLAKNNPKLHERPKGGRSFKRIDSL